MPFFVWLCCGFALLAAQPQSSMTVYREVAISPDAARVAWIQGGALLVAPASGTAAQAVAKKAEFRGHDIQWSPDSTRIAYLEDSQIHVLDLLRNGAPRKVTAFANAFVQSLRWSPDGKSFAVLYTENAKRAAGPTQAVTPDSGVVGENLDVQRIAVVHAATGSLQLVSPAGLYVHEYDWSPDSGGFAFTAAPPPGDNTWYDCDLYVMRLEAAASAKVVYKPEFQIAVPRWSPDGRSIAYIEGLMSDESATGGEIFVLDVSSDGARPRNVTPERQSSPYSLTWGAADRMQFAEHVGGGTAISTVNLATGQTERLWQGDESVTMSNAGETVAAVRSGWTTPPEIWVGKPGRSWRQFSDANREVKPAIGRVQNRTWKSDGFDVQGYLLYPVDYDPAKRYPMIVSVHGGPGAVTKPAWPGAGRGWNARFTRLGYFVLLPNPRGSFGQGERFTRANQRDLGFGDFRDIDRGIDEVLRQVPAVDGARLGITGWSYGGYMTMMAVTQTTRFRAAVAGAGISNLISYAGQNHITRWMFDYFGATAYDDPAAHMRSSPMTYIKQAKTPTLILVGERDGECPPPQSYEFWTGLKAMGVKTQFVIYPGEGHAIRKPEHQRDMNQRMEEWFGIHLNPQRPTGSTTP